MKKPKISVIMPVYNGELYLKEALASIFNQTFKNFELIVIDDGSTDKTLEILKKIADKRLKILINKNNLGLSKALNKGVFAAKGEYIARCDVDDVNDKNRFKKQVDFLDQNPKYVLVGSNADAINTKSRKIGFLKMPETDKQIRRSIIIRNNILHPSVMLRMETLKEVGNYRELFNLGAEEYDLWFRLLKKGKAYNLQEPLIKRRLDGKVYTREHHLRVELLALVVRIINFPRLFC